jgi:hypothetical protein
MNTNPNTCVNPTFEPSVCLAGNVYCEQEESKNLLYVRHLFGRVIAFFTSLQSYGGWRLCYDGRRESILLGRSTTVLYVEQYFEGLSTDLPCRCRLCLNTSCRGFFLMFCMPRLPFLALQLPVL